MGRRAHGSQRRGPERVPGGTEGVTGGLRRQVRELQKRPPGGTGDGDRVAHRGRRRSEGSRRACPAELLCTAGGARQEGGGAAAGPREERERVRRDEAAHLRRAGARVRDPGDLQGRGGSAQRVESRKITAKVAGEVLAVRKRMDGGRKIVEGLGKVGASEMSTDPKKFLKGMKRKLEEIRAMEKIPVKRVLRDVPTGLSAEGVSSVFVSLRWDRSEQYDEFDISKREEGVEWSGEDESGNGDRGKNGCIRVDKKKRWCFVCPLKPDTGYEFRVMGKKGSSETRWSEPVAVRTEERVVDEEIENAIHKFRVNKRDADRCFNLFDILVDISYKRAKTNKDGHTNNILYQNKEEFH